MMNFPRFKSEVRTQRGHREGKPPDALVNPDAAPSRIPQHPMVHYCAGHGNRTLRPINAVPVQYPEGINQYDPGRFSRGPGSQAGNLAFVLQIEGVGRASLRFNADVIPLEGAKQTAVVNSGPKQFPPCEWRLPPQKCASRPCPRNQVGEGPIDVNVFLSSALPVHPGRYFSAGSNSPVGISSGGTTQCCLAATWSVHCSRGPSGTKYGW